MLYLMYIKIGVKLRDFFVVGDKKFPQRVQPGTSHVRNEFMVKAFSYLISPRNLAISEVFSEISVFTFGGAPHGPMGRGPS